MAEDTATDTPPKDPPSILKKPKEGETVQMETAINILLPADGTSVIVDLDFTSPQIKLHRGATLDDVYRMVCDAKSQIEAMRSVSHHFTRVSKMAQAQQKAELTGKA